MRILLLTLSLFSVHVLFSQTNLSGNVKDTSEKRSLANAVVSLLKKDSTLYKFTRTDKSGAFLMQNVVPGAYRLLVTYPKFADYVDDIAVKNESLDLSTIALTQKSQLLQAVIIKSAGSVRIKGDTTEFVADSFRVREGATVEELLKKLPGFQVNSKGEITAQGQRVDKVLVDGEEFFGDDPTMATKNIGAKAVDKVQVFDTKTEQQTATGLSSGKEGKTINIKLKEDQKKGGFGKVSAGSDFQRYTDVNLLYNRFVNKKKVSLYATKSNTSTGSLRWDEQRKLGIEDDGEFDETGGFYINFSNDDEFNNWTLRGLPDAYTAGGLFSNKWNAEKYNVNGSYRYNRLGTTNTASTVTQNILPDSLFYTNQYTTSRNLNQQHAFNGKWEWKPDSLSSIKFTTATLRKTSAYENETATESLAEDKAPVNSGHRSTDGTSTKLQSDNSLQYKRLFKKAGRQLTAQLRFSYNEDDQNLFLRYQNNFYKGSVTDSVQTADQQKINNGHSNTVGIKVTHLEPLGNKWMLIGEYSYNHNAAQSNRNTFDKTSAGKYEILNPLYSNNFDMDVDNHNGSLVGRYKTKKMLFSVGNKVSAVQLNLLNRDNNIPTHYNFLNLRPQASFRYSPQQSTSFGINYNGSTVQPSISDLQPLRNNLDPLNLVVGNPDLKVGFRNEFQGNFQLYKMLSQQGMFCWFEYNSTSNAIVNSTTISAGGVKINKPVNVNGQRNYNAFLNFWRGEGQKKINPSAEIEFNGGTGVNIVNGLRNQTDYYNLEGGIGARYEVEQKWNVSVRPRIGYNSSVSSLNKEKPVRYFTYSGNADAWAKLPLGFEVNTNLRINFQQRISSFAGNPAITLWNGELSRKFLKKGAGKVSLYANDILNANRGFQRTISSNFIVEERYLRVAQYFMLKFEWSFNKMGGGEQ